MVRKVTNTFLGQMQTQSTCPYCNGSGQTITKKCTTCNGIGTAYGEEQLDLNLPAGLQEGMQMSVTGKGNAGKDEMIAAVVKRGFTPADDNEADALALLHWAIETQEV